MTLSLSQTYLSTGNLRPLIFGFLPRYFFRLYFSTLDETKQAHRRAQYIKSHD
jgi:hypothetical protein